MEYDMLKPARAENSPTGSSQRLGALSAAESGARLLPPGEGQAAADNGSIRSVVAAGGDAFDAGQARAALYRREAGVHDHDSDDSGSDVDMDEEPQPCGLSLATCSLMGGRALSQAFNLCANGQQPTGPQASAAGEEDGNEVRCLIFRGSRRLAGCCVRQQGLIVVLVNRTIRKLALLRSPYWTNTAASPLLLGFYIPLHDKVVFSFSTSVLVEQKCCVCAGANNPQTDAVACAWQSPSSTLAYVPLSPHSKQNS